MSTTANPDDIESNTVIRHACRVDGCTEGPWTDREDALDHLAREHTVDEWLGLGVERVERDLAELRDDE